MPLNFCPYPQFNGMPLGKLQVLAAVCTPMAAVQVLTGCNLHWWSFSSTIGYIFLLANEHGGAKGVCAAPGPL